MNSINTVRITNKDDEPFEKLLESMSRGRASLLNESIRPGDGVPKQFWESNLAGTEAPAERRKTEMKNNLRDKFRDFLASEEGRVGIKAPLAVGIAGGGVIVSTGNACIR